MTLTTSFIVQSGKPDCQDRAEIISSGGRTILALADGADGISGGAQAADGFVNRIHEAADRLSSAADCVRLLQAIDLELARRKDCGETTGVVVIVNANSIYGSSVGDSTARLFASDGNGELTYGQQPKPLLGSGEAPTPRGFSWPIEDGTLVVASAGLWQQTSIEAIRSRVATRDSTDLALRLAELARLPSGAFPGDVAVITCRIAGARLLP